jgi:anti-sigma regulatory factor (Ser/Thr protein kinase)
MASLVGLSSIAPLDFVVAELAASLPAQRCAQRMAVAIGFPDVASEEIALVVAELASNLIKHAKCGTVSIRPICEGDRIGIAIVACDEGPGISDPEQAFTDGFSTTGSLGYGLGTVNRLMDDVEIRSAKGLGTRVLCRRWIREQFEESVSASPSRWDVSVFTRARGQAPENGDAFVVRQRNGHLLAGLIDGLGHGPLAQKAAIAAQHYVHAHDCQPLDKIFAGASRACRATRGVVMALARFPTRERIQFASIGNIEVRAWSGSERLPFTLKRGILGVQDTSARVQEFPWQTSWLLVLHTDGLRTHWQWADFPGIERQPAQVVAATLMRTLANHHDDATVMAIRDGRP